MKSHFIPTGMAVIKKMDNNKCCWGRKKLEPLRIVGHNAKLYSPSIEQFGSSSKI